MEDLFGKNFTKQDSIVLNQQRAFEDSIDLSNYIVKKKNSVFLNKAGGLLIFWPHPE